VQIADAALFTRAVGASRRRDPLPFIGRLALFALLVAAEVLAANQGYYTVGEVWRSFTLVGVALINAGGAAGFVLAALSGSRRGQALMQVLLLIVAAGAILPQVVLGERLISLRHEAQTIVGHVENSRRVTGSYPADLAGYSFARISLAPHVSYTLDPQRGGYRLSYWIATPNVSNDYSPRTGWVYYPD
jgi:hypothetical protein